MKKSSKLGFSLIELSVVILIIGILIIGITKGSRIITEAKLKSAKSLTNSSPLASMSDLVLWFDATDSTNLKTSTFANIATTSFGNINDNDPVSAWQDRNPQSNDKITVTSSSTDSTRPVYVNSGINGLPALKFTATSSQYLSSSKAPIAAGNDTYTIVGVFRPYDVTATTFVFTQSLNTSTVSRMASIILFGQNLGFGGSTNNYYPYTAAINNNYIFVARVNNNLANNVTVYRNGSSSSGVSDGGAAGLDVGADIFTVGGRSSTPGVIANFYNGLVSEIIVFNRSLTNSEISAINSYLSTKYSIKLN